MANIFQFVAKRLVDRSEKTVESSSEFRGSASSNESSSFDVLLDIADNSDDVPSSVPNRSFGRSTDSKIDRTNFTDAGAGGENDSNKSSNVATLDTRRDANAVEGESNLSKDLHPRDEDWKERASEMLVNGFITCCWIITDYFGFKGLMFSKGCFDCIHDMWFETF